MSRRQPRRGREQRKTQAKREPYPRILIVCEGSKTEPSYFLDARRTLKLSTANIEVAGRECGSSPATVVTYSVQKFEEDKDFDRVFCVFDRDSHPDYDAARNRCLDLRKRKSNGEFCQFTPITSWPCFEFWLILHFQETSAPIVGVGNRSPGDVALSTLQRLYPNYKKGAPGVFTDLRDKLPDAIRRAKQINSGSFNNPHTRIAELVEYLLSLGRPYDSPL